MLAKLGVADRHELRRVASASRIARPRLPRFHTSFVGRAVEVDAVGVLLDDRRLVTVVGTAGGWQNPPRRRGRPDQGRRSRGGDLVCRPRPAALTGSSLRRSATRSCVCSTPSRRPVSRSARRWRRSSGRVPPWFSSTTASRSLRRWPAWLMISSVPPSDLRLLATSREPLALGSPRPSTKSSRCRFPPPSSRCVGRGGAAGTRSRQAFR